MARADDVAAYVLRARGRMTTMKLHKLMYYAQAWSLAWDGVALFSQKIAAWDNGPVLPEIWKKTEGAMHVREWSAGSPDALTKDQRELVDEVLRFYGDLEGDVLGEITHREAPWRDARAGSRERSPRITDESMRRYYGEIAKGTTSRRIPEALSRGLRVMLTMPDELARAVDEPTMEVDIESLERALAEA